jgi:two-component system sensor histidine kinase KdpD
LTPPELPFRQAVKTRESERPDPETLLAQVRAADLRSTRAKLKIFLGFAPGVGKTFRMLQTAHVLLREGVDVVVGAVETHGRPETEVLLEGLSILPRRRLEYKGKSLEEFDLDAALSRRPKLLVLDELAHTNVPGSRHGKRFDDVLELLDAGIDVHTTLNIQHVESLNDVVAQITRIQVRETVPDSILERADEVHLVDVAPEELLTRLHEGKVYLPDVAERAAEQFFRRGNLLALRELALRRTAERVREDVEAERRILGTASTWPTAERIMVCVGPAPSSADLVRAARRMAAGLRAPWLAVHATRDGAAPLSEEDAQRVEEFLRLAESLGGEVARLRGPSIAASILDFARARNVTRILVGKPTHRRLRDLPRGSLLDALVRGSAEIEVSAISGDRQEAPEKPPEPAPPQALTWEPHAKAVGLIAVTTAVALAVRSLLPVPDLEMLYVLAMMISGVAFGRGPSVVAAAAAVAAYDFFFVPPALTFEVTDARYILTFVMMFGVGLAMSTLTGRLKRQEADARFREHRTRALFELSRDLVSAGAPAEISRIVAHHASSVFRCGAIVLLPQPDGTLSATGAVPEDATLGPTESGVARWVFAHGRPGGRGTDTIPGAGALAAPIGEQPAPLGVLALVQGTGDALDVEQRAFLEAIARQAAFALDRARLSQTARVADLRAKSEELRSTLLSSVSHDLRTPLAAIVGAVTTVRDDTTLPAEVKRDMLDTIVEEADRLERLVSDLLDMTRLASGTLAVRKDWVPLEEVVGSALGRLEARLDGMAVTTRLSPDLPSIALDPVLVEQLLINLLDNAAKHARRGGQIDIEARRDGESVMVEVADRGPGIEAGREEKIFERFPGLGLPIARAIARAHGGNLVAGAREGGGAVFRLTLPTGGTPPPAAPAEQTA